MAARYRSQTARIAAVGALVCACAGDGPVDPDPGNGPPPTGSLTVTAATTGVDLDTEYRASIGQTTLDVPANGNVTFTNVAVGSASVSLSDVADNCDVQGSNPVSVTVSASAMASAAFTVACELVGGVDAILAQANVSLEDAMFAAANVGSVSDLDDVSFEEAHTLFTQALASAPTNHTAAFGVAVTTVFRLEDDAEVRSLAEEWEAWSEDVPVESLDLFVAPPTPLRWGRAQLPLDLAGADVRRLASAGGLAVRQLMELTSLTDATVPSLAQSQDVLLRVVRPAVEAALAALARIDDAAFVFIVTPRMQGEDATTADSLQLDHTEVLVLRASLEAALASIDIATAYLMVPNPTDAAGFVAAMTPGSSFLTLAPGGAPRLAAALPHIETAVTLLRSAIDHLEAETDDQSDDIIKYDRTGNGDGIDAAELMDARNGLIDIDAVLDGPATVTLFEGDPDEVQFTMNARAFFTNPIPDFKELLPAYQVSTALHGATTKARLRWVALNLDEWQFPDPTFRGILPGMMSSQDFTDTFEPGELFFDFSRAGGSYQLITIDGVDCHQSASGGGPGCTVQGAQYANALVYIDGDGTRSRAEFYLYGTAFTDPQGPYIVTAQGGGALAVAMDLVDSSNTQLTLTASVVEKPGYTSTDALGRQRGGSTLTYTYRGAQWVFEKQH
jgi:hypothetical protein